MLSFHFSIHAHSSKTLPLERGSPKEGVVVGSSPLPLLFVVAVMILRGNALHWSTEGEGQEKKKEDWGCLLRLPLGSRWTINNNS